MNEIERPKPNSARAVRTYPIAPDRLLAAFGRAVETLPRWNAGSSEEGEVRAVRTTRLLRFRDDVKVRVLAEGAGAGAELTSTSRIGKGDLDQNPRNIKEPLRAVEDDVLQGQAQR
ncbi:MAG: DUF1499 domain-containing protein [Actinomycetota bacterium]|nr:DUF1499 domain-containing protein [Actinomycetota bacterium]